MVTQPKGSPDPVPDSAQAKRPAAGQPKRVAKVAARPIGNPSGTTGAGQGRPTSRPRYSGRGR